MPSADNEFSLIRWIRAQAGLHPRVPVGIGDDAAVLRFPQPAESLLAVDLLMEGTHFRLPDVTARQVGRKALGVNLSDIAAMAGRPLAALVSVAWSRQHPADVPRGVQAGIQELADEFGVAVIGGDTNVWDGPLVVSVTIVGEATERGPVRRCGAQAGDWILATGDFGGSLEWKHVNFRPRIDEALKLHSLADLHAMIDVSDGLAADLLHILDESRVAAELWANRIPVSAAAHRSCHGRSALEHALGDGEDFELLLTLAADDAQRLLAAPPFQTPLTHIGRVVSGQGATLIAGDGTVQPLARSGWEHSF